MIRRVRRISMMMMVSVSCCIDFSLLGGYWCFFAAGSLFGTFWSSQMLFRTIALYWIIGHVKYQ